MLFLDAIAQLESGIAMRRTSWAVDEGYLSIMPGMSYVWKILLLPNPNAGNFIFSVDDFHATDWEEFVLANSPIEAQL